MSLHAHEALYLEYRAGRAGFDRVWTVIRSDVEALANRMSRTWRGSYLSPNDLVQEMAIAIWQALDDWDSDRGNPIGRHVTYRAGNCAEKRLAKSLGWPNKRRTRVARAVPLEEWTNAVTHANQIEIVSRRAVLASDRAFAELAEWVALAGDIDEGMSEFARLRGTKAVNEIARYKRFAREHRRTSLEPTEC